MTFILRSIVEELVEQSNIVPELLHCVGDSDSNVLTFLFSDSDRNNGVVWSKTADI